MLAETTRRAIAIVFAAAETEKDLGRQVFFFFVIDARKLVADHTGQSSQLFPVTTGRNAQFLQAEAMSV